MSARELRAAQESEILRLNRLYDALSGVRQAIVRMPTRDELFRRVCQVLVENGGFRVAWIGWHDPKAQTIEPVAMWGDADEYVAKLNISTDDRPEGLGPTATAFREERPYICNDMLEDPAALPWRAEAQRLGFRASAAFPIRQNDDVCGTINVYANDVGYFKEKEIVLLREAAADVSFALDNLVREATRKQAEELLREAHDTLEQRVIERTAQLETANRELEAFSTAVSHDLRVAEASDRLKSAFLATMSHELRTPLNSILGFTGILQQKLAGPLNDEQSRQLGMVQTSARHLLELINDVLDLSKIEAGQMEVHDEPFDLPDSIRNLADSVGTLVAQKDVSLDVEISPEVTMMVSDRRRVEQILLNLLSNAIKFTDHGIITLSVDLVRGEDSGIATEKAARFRVADTGIGIRPEDLDTLFQPFRQLDSGMARLHEGTGLGLVICRRLVTLLGGEITVTSEWSKGSEFTVILPMERVG